MKILTVQKIADMMEVSDATVRTWIRKHGIKHVKHLSSAGKTRIYVDEDEFKAFFYSPAFDSAPKRKKPTTQTP
jgi:excisionase family DNA binding protein